MSNELVETWDAERCMRVMMPKEQAKALEDIRRAARKRDQEAARAERYAHGKSPVAGPMQVIVPHQGAH